MRVELRASDYQVTEAANGEEALDLVSREEPSLVLLDLMLPGIDGIAVCRELRANSGARIPILMLTAKDLIADKVEGFEAGADDYLVKPFSLAELDVRLKALIRRSRPPEARRALSVGDLKFDLDTLEAERAGVAIKLNPTTRRILVVLMQNANRVVTRAELEKELWGDAPPEGDFLRAHMHALRAAIDKNFSDKLLHTVHGIGYRIAADEPRP
jgi:DNA-binding response OmpR family regulator